MSSTSEVGKIKNLIVVSDLHCGCKLGLCPPGNVKLDDGGLYLPSVFQQQVWELWKEFWGKWVPQVTRGEPYDLVINGDLIEGVHHRATTPISHNMEDQLRIAEQVCEPIVARVHELGGHFFLIRGTAAHVGESAIWEEQLGKRLGAVPNGVGQYARYDLWKRVGSALVHLMHHVGVTGSAAHEASAVNAELTAEYVEAARWRKEPPDFVVRSHRHRSIAVDLNSAKGYAAAIVTPGWQGKPMYAWRVAGARISEPQMGGILIRQGNEEYYYRRRVWGMTRSVEE